MSEINAEQARQVLRDAELLCAREEYWRNLPAIYAVKGL